MFFMFKFQRNLFDCQVFYCVHCLVRFLTRFSTNDTSLKNMEKIFKDYNSSHNNLKFTLFILSSSIISLII
jgi:hypothetical protein